MNDKARKQARRAELEFTLWVGWNRDRSRVSFADWLESKSVLEGSAYQRDEAIELIALYGE